MDCFIILWTVDSLNRRLLLFRTTKILPFIAYYSITHSILLQFTLTEKLHLLHTPSPSYGQPCLLTSSYLKRFFWSEEINPHEFANPSIPHFLKSLSPSFSACWDDMTLSLSLSLICPEIGHAWPMQPAGVDKKKKKGKGGDFGNPRGFTFFSDDIQTSRIFPTRFLLS